MIEKLEGNSIATKWKREGGTFFFVFVDLKQIEDKFSGEKKEEKRMDAYGQFLLNPETVQLCYFPFWVGAIGTEFNDSGVYGVANLPLDFQKVT